MYLWCPEAAQLEDRGLPTLSDELNTEHITAQLHWERRQKASLLRSVGKVQVHGDASMASLHTDCGRLLAANQELTGSGNNRETPNLITLPQRFASIIIVCVCACACVQVMA